MIGAHICDPTCWPGLVTTADGTQWIDHDGAWDESLLADDFFGPPPNYKEAENMTSIVVGGQLHIFGVVGSTAYHWWQEIGPPASAWHMEKLPE
jgi:hypothetical protein